MFGWHKQVWFVGRDDASNVTLSYATGLLAGGDDLPTIALYPGNPVLASDAAVLGVPCADACWIDAVAVARPPAGTALWPALGFEFYEVLVSRTRYGDPGGVVHELIPPLQPRPNDG